ncbi:hypothetical protein FraQA3DRAFT_3203 [Frankia sp. QA3]|nr:hypothetical protein FraQA3DRAFT_3203 [Frankia sp. QA3]
MHRAGERPAGRPDRRRREVRFEVRPRGGVRTLAHESNDLRADREEPGHEPARLRLHPGQHHHQVRSLDQPLVDVYSTGNHLRVGKRQDPVGSHVHGIPFSDDSSGWPCGAQQWLSGLTAFGRKSGIR